MFSIRSQELHLDIGFIKRGLSIEKLFCFYTEAAKNRRKRPLLGNPLVRIGENMLGEGEAVSPAGLQRIGQGNVFIGDLVGIWLWDFYVQHIEEL
jgi:hypothetical protein